jgi:bifunctional DNA-binding transcriptional regulator/antitoxin component of YhaV-PrlF toxin-antitoxin module
MIVYFMNVYLLRKFMEYTVIPSVKGQITLPPKIRKKYDIGKNTPIVIEDMGNGELKVKVKRTVDHDLVQYYEKNGSVGLHFKNGVDPQVLIDMINKMDGQD